MTKLPCSWANAKFSDFGTWIGGGTPSKANPDFWHGDIPWISPKDMKSNVIRTAIDGITLNAIENSAAKLVPEGSVLIVTRSGILAHTLPVAITAMESTLNQDLKALALPEGISSEFIAWGMRAFEQRILNTCRKGGTTVHSIEMPRLTAFELPIAPTNEQRRIVERIEAMFDEIDHGIENLKKAKTSLGLYRQSLLKSAFEGRLTADWRAQNADKLESPDALLARIQKERDTRYKSALEDWKAAVKDWRKGGEIGKKPVKPKAPDKLRFSDLPVDGFTKLPYGWSWVPLGWLLTVERRPMTTGPFGTLLKKQEHQSFGVPVLGIENIGSGRFLPGNKIFVTPEKAVELKSFEARKGDLVISRSGTVGEICEVPISFDGSLISTNLLLVRPNVDIIYSDFFVKLFQGSSSVQKQIKELCKGSSREFLNQAILKAMRYPLCSPEEQVEIMRILDERLSAADTLEKEIDAGLARADALRQSILKQAFSGKLVPQDPNDEPASVLLERIKAEKTKAPKARRKRKATA
ncbi:restriction endonuclease subunit S [uncultured Cohaesibacter sp.]|uniref:restriction endonuclease subunit S n=1 Tax=uncultured Cohaesibacter sp. TaxID=1002546 RepID=UPI002AA6CA38|nr:restriction endonuclease subunit S [uncultured Cohaesibacter sp.]